ncbi:MAG: hypothetical protein KAI24_05500 [Planctomycetes bacterium]|nr:hypothetical protein [Planctomycetota bacterium]
MTELTLPLSVERRNKLDISLGYCNEIVPEKLASFGPGFEVKVDDPAQLVDFLEHDASEDRLYYVPHLRTRDREWEYVCFAKRGPWSAFCSIFSTALAYNPMFGDGRRRRLCCGGTRIISRTDLEKAVHHRFDDRAAELTAAVEMDLDLSEAMTGKNLSNGFNIGGSKTLVYLGDCSRRPLVAADDVRAFAHFMAKLHNSISQSIPVFVGTGSDLNFGEHGAAYYDHCSRISPNYVGNPSSARRWSRTASDNTTLPTANGVMACLRAVIERLAVPPDQRGILVKGLGGIGQRVARTFAEEGWQVYATEVREEFARSMDEELGDRLKLVDEERWGELRGVSIFSPNASSGSVNQANLAALKQMGVRAVIGGENNILDHDVDAQTVHDEGLLTFADFLLNGGGAWVVGAEMLERPVENVVDWIEKYQVPTVLATIDAAEATGRSPQLLFREFIARKVAELMV